MRKRFVVSAHPEALSGASSLFIAEPYVYHVLAKENLIGNYESIDVAEHTRKNQVDLTSDANFVDRKYAKYLPILTQRLNTIHAAAYSANFWRKCLSLGLVRYLTGFYDLYKIVETHFDEGEHTCKILSRESFSVPSDFEEHRKYFLNSDIGQEQIFSIYMESKFPDKYPHYDSVASNDTQVQTVARRSAWLRLRTPIARLLDFLKRFRRLPTSIIHTQTENDPIIGIFGTSISPKNLRKLDKESDGTIIDITRAIQIQRTHSKKDMEKREILGQIGKDFDEFDAFFFRSIVLCLPSLYVEDFPALQEACNTIIGKFSRMRQLVSEWWLSDSYISALLAFAKENNITHIYNEHNCFFHPFGGIYLEHVAPLCDVYASLGWHSLSVPNLLPRASLYDFTIEGSFQLKYDILFVGTPYLVKMQHFSSAWGFAAESVPRNVTFLEIFFSHLQEATLCEISYRSYPRDFTHGIQTYDKEFMLRRYIARLKGLTDTSESAKIQMKQSRLVIIDYVSTSYLECLLMNLPFIFFWNPNTYYLKQEYADFFSPLQQAGICQTDPRQAAALVEKIRIDPSSWWFSPKVQDARQIFLQANLGKPESMLNYLISLAKESQR